MTDQHSERILEETHLREILEEAERQLKQAHEAVERKETELQELKREIRENTEHGAADLSTTDGFEALVERGSGCIRKPALLPTKCIRPFQTCLTSAPNARRVISPPSSPVITFN